MRKTSRKLQLSKETLKTLSDLERPLLFGARNDPPTLPPTACIDAAGNCVQAD
jgi:hypothetical protein